MTEKDIKTRVKEAYGLAALQVAHGLDCCRVADPTSGCCDPITTNIYEDVQIAGLPDDAVQASLGCGNPTALAGLAPGEMVLDLGCGGGIDVFLAARRVGPMGKVYGLDMTDDMLALARENQQKAGIENTEFLKGEMENIPLPDDSVDVIISNCVISLSTDKSRVFAEAFRVLRPGGRVAVSDVVVRGQVPDRIRRNVELWIGCMAGALEESEYRDKLAAAGFIDIDIEPTRIYTLKDMLYLLEQEDIIDADGFAAKADSKFMSAFVRAKKS